MYTLFFYLKTFYFPSVPQIIKEILFTQMFHLKIKPAPTELIFENNKQLS